MFLEDDAEGSPPLEDGSTLGAGRETGDDKPGAGEKKGAQKADGGYLAVICRNARRRCP